MKYLIIFLSLIAISCSKENDFAEQNENEINAYIEKNNLDAIKSKSGLYYVINKAGVGLTPSNRSDVKVSYTGYFTDGKVFDKSSEGISFNLQNVIKGWTEGIRYFRKGGEGILLIPSSLGYGPEDKSGIPGGSVLIFNIKLIEIYN